MIANCKPQKLIKDIKPDKVISFNYTHTYSMLYDSSIPVCYIHGECGAGKENMVLGIDEYQTDEADNDMAIFKKFVQRIRKKNDISYRTWYNKIVETVGALSGKVKPKDLSREIYVYGHSLDVTDRDVLKLFFNLDCASIHVYAYDKVDEGRKYPNLIRIMGEDRLIKKATCDPPMFEAIITSDEKINNI